MSTREQIPTKAAAAPAIAPQQLTPAPLGKLQRKCACGGSGHSGGDCAECKKKKMEAQGGAIAGFDFSRIPIYPPKSNKSQPSAGVPSRVSVSTAPGSVARNLPAGDQAISGTATRAKADNLPDSGPAWDQYGGFHWTTQWDTDGTSGWLVQNIRNQYSGNFRDGSPVTNASAKADPNYWEAWTVSDAGIFTPARLDNWDRLRVWGSQGQWHTQGTVYWTNTDPRASGFRQGQVPNAGQWLLSAWVPPADLSPPLLERTGNGMWRLDGSQVWPGCAVT